jgi:hypothetical protein
MCMDYTTTVNTMLPDMPKMCMSLVFKWQHWKLICVSCFLYIAFCVSCVIIPDSIHFGESLCFAYIFSMMQMIEVAFFIRGDNLLSLVLMCVTLFTASVMPTTQIFLVMEGGYSKETRDMYSYVYMLKEVVLHIVMRYNAVKAPCISRATYAFIVCIWAITETVFYFSVGDNEYESDRGAFNKAVIAARLAPQFFMAFITTRTQMSQGL